MKTTDCQLSPQVLERICVEDQSQQVRQTKALRLVEDDTAAVR
jgi:hypothetical protein